MLPLLIHLIRPLSALCLAALFLVCLTVIASTLLEFQATWASGLCTFLLTWLIMLSGALAYTEKAHLGLEILVEHFDLASRRHAALISHSLVLLFSLSVLLFGGSQLVFQRFQMAQSIPSLGISQAWFYLSLPTAGLLFSLAAIAHLFSPSPLSQES